MANPPAAVAGAKKDEAKVEEEDEYIDQDWPIMRKVGWVIHILLCLAVAVIGVGIAANSIYLYYSMPKDFRAPYFDSILSFVVISIIVTPACLALAVKGPDKDDATKVICVFGVLVFMLWVEFLVIVMLIQYWDPVRAGLRSAQTDAAVRHAVGAIGEL